MPVLRRFKAGAPLGCTPTPACLKFRFRIKLRGLLILKILRFEPFTEYTLSLPPEPPFGRRGPKQYSLRMTRRMYGLMTVMNAVIVKDKKHKEKHAAVAVST